MIYYPAVIYPADADGLVGCTVPDLLINASGTSQDEALKDATTIMNELLLSMVRDGEAFPEPTASDQIDLRDGVLEILTTSLPLAAE